MKKVLLSLMALGLFAITSCIKDEAEPTPKTSLEVSIKDNLGNPVRDAVVKLYSSETDWKKGTNQVGAVQYSDAEGRVTFDNLSNIKYYWFAEKGCLNNVNGSITTTSPLAEGVKNTVNSILTGTGTLKFTSTSSNPYRIYINGTPIFDMNGNTTETLYYIPVGAYTLRVLQLSGYVLYPTDKTYNGNLTCGGTLTTTFP